MLAKALDMDEGIQNSFNLIFGC